MKVSTKQTEIIEFFHGEKIELIDIHCRLVNVYRDEMTDLSSDGGPYVAEMMCAKKVGRLRSCRFCYEYRLLLIVDEIAEPVAVTIWEKMIFF